MLKHCVSVIYQSTSVWAFPHVCVSEVLKVKSSTQASVLQFPQCCWVYIKIKVWAHMHSLLSHAHTPHGKKNGACSTGPWGDNWDRSVRSLWMNWSWHRIKPVFLSAQRHLCTEHHISSRWRTCRDTENTHQLPGRQWKECASVSERFDLN